MANIDLNKGNKFTLTRIGNKTAITDSSDHVHATKHFRNQVVISGSEFSGLTGNSPAFAVKGNQNRVVLFEADDLATIQPILELKHTSTTQNHHLTQYFNHTSADWCMGIIHGSSGGQNDNGYFIISNNSNISVDNTRTIMLDLAKNVYIPNGGLVVGGEDDGSESDPGDGVIITKGSGNSFGAGVNSSAINTTNFGISGNTGTGMNIINLYGEGDGHDGQTANEIRFHGHEGRGQGLVFTDEDYSDQNWFIGTPYQGNQNFFTIGYDDDTEYHPRQRAAIFSVQGPAEGQNGGHGSIRIQDWDDNTDHAYTTHYLWFQHNGTDGRLGAATGDFAFHNGGDEDSATHHFRFGSSGEFLAINLGSFSSGGNNVKRDGNEIKFISSTRKVKKDIKSAGEQLSTMFDKLRPVEFKHKGDNRHAFSFIAEEVADIHPSFAAWDKDFARDEKGQLIDTGERDKDKRPIFKLDSDGMAPSDIEDRAILAAAVAKIQQLEDRIKELENK